MFNSQTSFPESLMSAEHLALKKQNALPKMWVINDEQEKWHHLAQIIRSALQMELFGFDVCVESGTGKCYVVDINYFPGYKGVPDLYGLILNQLQKEYYRKECY